MKTTEQLEKSGDFVALSSRGEYDIYFAQITRVFKILLAWNDRVLASQNQEGKNEEAEVLKVFLAKVQASLEALALRQLHNHAQELRLDLNESGFPHFVAFSELQADLAERETRLQKMSRQETLKEQALDHIFQYGTVPQLQLWELAQRQYLRSLDGQKLFLPYTPGELVLKAEDSKRRQYVFSWACFDFQKNMPFVHVLLFEQDVKEEPLHAPGSSSLVRFLNVIETEGARAPSCLTLAVTIDQLLFHIHPKVLKRIRVGPILLPRFSKEKNLLLEQLRQHGEGNDFALSVENEIIVSGNERQLKRGAFRADQVLQIFVVPQMDLECFERQVSKVYKLLILPQSVRTAAALETDSQFRNYRDHKVVTFDRKDELYDV